MAYLCRLLLIAILTVASGATPLDCSDVQSPASGDSHNTDLSQVTTLQYCIIDNCTIMRIDTGQQLDIVYTTESLLIVAPKDGLNSMVITKIDDELPCLGYHNTSDDNDLNMIHAVIVPLALMVSVGTLIIHILFKDLCTSLFGQLLMFYNLAIVITGCGTIFLQLTHYWITVNSQTICHTATVITTFGVSGAEVFATNILTHSAYIMYHCYHLKSGISKKRSNYLFRRYTGYAAFALVLLFFVTIAYDWRTGNGKYTILASGHCIILDHPLYNTLAISGFVTTINEILQMTMFSTYLVYLYKFNNNVRAAGVTLQHSRKF